LCGIAWSLLSNWKVFEAALDKQLVALTDLKNPVLRNLDGLCLQQNKYSKSGCHPQETLIPAGRRANFQSMIWAKDDKPIPGNTISSGIWLKH
jgi:hypothetical protein